ncbi:MAG: nucleoside hydrolase [Gammaproteobacteria bacterium]|nr:nucleoside hydrolase [Gammaproteobacteria bacterium]
MKLSRRHFHKIALAILSSAPAFSRGSLAEENTSSHALPLILDTDIGDDIDDTWALMMLLRMQNIDLRLITTDFGNTRYRTRLLAKLLQSLGKDDIPLGIGLDPEDKPGNQSVWLGDYQLESYPGKVHEDGVQALIDSIMSSPEPVTLLCIGPLMNVAEALRRQPAIAGNARFVGMYGSIRIGYDGEEKPAAEWNVKVDPQSLQEVFAAPWECTITPLDTCGLIKLKGDDYQKIYSSKDDWMKILMDNYRLWLPKVTWLDPLPDFEKMSSTLFDTLAVHLLQTEDYLHMENLPLRVNDEGFTVIDEENGRMVRCASAWKDKPAFEKHLVSLLTGSG